MAIFNRTRLDVIEPPTRKNRGYSLIGLVGLIMGLLLGLGIAQAVHSEATADAVNDHSSGILELTNADGDSVTYGLLLTTHFDISVRGMSVDSRMTQTFRNETDQWQEGRYVFPLPDTAAVYRVVMTVGDRRIVSQIKEKQQAKAIYQAARDSGRLATLTSQQRPNLFTQSVANIAPGEQLNIEVYYQHPLQLADRTMTLRLPTTLTPRYIPGTPIVTSSENPVISDGRWGWSTPTDQVIDADLISPPQTPEEDRFPTMTVDININSGLSIQKPQSPFHELIITRQESGYQAHSDAPLPMNRDLVIHWQPEASAMPVVGMMMETGPFTSDSMSEAGTESSNSDTAEEFVQLTLIPPVPDDADQHLKQIPRDVQFIIDTSGSMQGTSIVQARQSLLNGLEHLTAGDHFNIIEFNNQTRTLFRESLPASHQNLQQARQFIRSLEAGGGTEMAPAISTALMSKGPQGALKQVIFITDGSVGNESELFSLIHKELRNARLFTVGIGSAPNSFFMRKSAQFGGGTFVHIGDISQVETSMSELFIKLSAPIMKDISVSWPKGISEETFPSRLPDLYLGQSITLHTRLSQPLREGEHTILIQGNLANRRWQHQFRFTKSPGTSLQLKSQQSEASGALGRRWARAKIEQLMDNGILGWNETEVREAVLPLAVHHQLLSPYTSFVAVENIIRRKDSDLLQRQSVANAIPKGQTNSALTVAMPKTSTSLYRDLIIAILATLMICVGFRLVTPKTLSGNGMETD